MPAFAPQAPAGYVEIGDEEDDAAVDDDIAKDEAADDIADD